MPTYTSHQDGGDVSTVRTPYTAAPSVAPYCIRRGDDSADSTTTDGNDQAAAFAAAHQNPGAPLAAYHRQRQLSSDADDDGEVGCGANSPRTLNLMNGYGGGGDGGEDDEAGPPGGRTSSHEYSGGEGVVDSSAARTPGRRYRPPDYRQQVEEQARWGQPPPPSGDHLRYYSSSGDEVLGSSAMDPPAVSSSTSRPRRNNSSSYAAMGDGGYRGSIIGSSAFGGSPRGVSSPSAYTGDGGGGGGVPALSPDEIYALRQLLRPGGGPVRNTSAASRTLNELFKDEDDSMLNDELNRTERTRGGTMVTIGASMALGKAAAHAGDEAASAGNDSIQSNYPEFSNSTHAWAVFAPNSKWADRVVGTLIIAFQLFTYWLFASEAMEDYRRGIVAVTTTHDSCSASGFEPKEENLSCEAESTSYMDAFVSFTMLGVFLASDVQQAYRSILQAGTATARVFASIAGIEVICAFLAAAVSISQKLYIGEVTDAVEVGVGLLFIRELSTRAYHAIRDVRRHEKDFRSFFMVLIGTVAVGLIMHPLFVRLLAP